MPTRILHVLDATTPADALELLAQSLDEVPHQQMIATLGHRSTADLVTAAGIDCTKHPLLFLHSMGWADPTGWRGVAKCIRTFRPTHVHAWGIPAACAAMMARFKGPRLVTLVDLPRPWHLPLLTMIHRGGPLGAAGPCRWIVTSTWLKRELHAHALAADAVTMFRPSPRTHSPNPIPSPNAIREDLGLTAADGPLVLLGGEGSGGMLARPGIDPTRHGGRGGPRHDLGLWSTAILRQVFPRLRTIVREDRGLPDHGLERLMNDLPEEDIVVLAPASYSWAELLSIADLMLVTPDGPFSGGCIAHALAAGVPVIGTPVDAVREYLNNAPGGMLAASCRPREIAAAIESYLSQPDRPRGNTPHNTPQSNAAQVPWSAMYEEIPIAALQTA